MKHTGLLLVIAVFALNGLSLSAQIIEEGDQNAYYGNTGVNNQGISLLHKGRSEENLGNAIGSRYIEDKFQRAVVQLPDGRSTNFFARYDGNLDIVELSKNLDGSEVQMLVKSPGVSITFGGSGLTYEYNNFKRENGELFNRFLVKFNIESAPYGLYKSQEISFTRGEVAKTSYDVDKPHRFDLKEFYFLEKDKQLFLLEANKKKILSAFDEKYQDLVSDYIKKNKLKFKDEADFVKIVEYYNGIQTAK